MTDYARPRRARWSLLCAAVLASVTAPRWTPPAEAGTTARPKATRPKAARPAARPTSTRRTPVVATAVAAGPAATPTSAPAPTITAAPARGTVVVLAASSLTAAFRDLATAFERANPAATVALSTAGSSTLVSQVRNGAPADVLATADTSTMDDVVQEGLVDGRPQLLARNRLMIVVPKGNPMRVRTIADLADPDVEVGLGAPGVPVGDYARRMFAAAGLKVTPRTLEPNVAAIVTKAVLHEIDAGIVYVSDVASDEYRVDGIAIPDAQNLLASYPIATVTTGSNRTGGTAFVAFARSPAGQAILRRHKLMVPATS